MLSQSLQQCSVQVTLLFVVGACGVSHGKIGGKISDADTGSTGEDDTALDSGNSCDSDEGPGGEYSVTVTLDTADPYASIVQDRIAMRLYVWGFSDGRSVCNFDPTYCEIAIDLVSPDETVDVPIPSGWVCGAVAGDAYNEETVDGALVEYVYDCGAGDGPTYVADDLHVAVTLAVTCERDFAPEGD